MVLECDPEKRSKRVSFFLGECCLEKAWICDQNQALLV